METREKKADKSWKECFSEGRFEPNLSSVFWFETTSFWARKFYTKKVSSVEEGANYLNLGCGSNKYEGFVNADFFIMLPSSIKNALKKILFEIPKRLLKGKGQDEPDWMLDLRYPLRCEDDVWDGVYSEHVFEHISPKDVCSLLSELFRTMKEGAVLRIVVPDLAKYVRFYRKEEVSEGFSQFGLGAIAVRCLTQGWGHLCTYDAELLGKLLEDAGFSDVNEVSFGEGRNPDLIKDSPERAWESLYMEGVKK